MWLHFKHLVSDKISAAPGGLPCMLVSMGEGKTQSALICELPSLSRAVDVVFGKWFCCCHM